MKITTEFLKSKNACQEGIDMKINESVKIIGGNNEIGQPTMIGKVGKVSSLGREYLVDGKKTREVYVNIKYFGMHVFNDYHLSKVGKNKRK